MATATATATATTTPVCMPLDIGSILSSNGPVVDAVLLSTTNEIDTIRIDTTPKKQEVAKILGGPFTFLGQYEEEGIVLMVRKENVEVINPHKLQPPFDNTEIKGDILAMKVSDSSEENVSNDDFFLNYTKEEYAKFAVRTDVVAPPMQPPMETDDEEEDDESENEEDDDVSIEEGEDDDDDDDDDDDEEESDEDDGEAFINLLMGQVLKKFQEENGRDPDEQELQALKSAIAQKMGLGSE